MPAPEEMSGSRVGSVITKPIQYRMPDEKTEKVVKKYIFQIESDVTVHPERRFFVQPVVEEFFDILEKDNPLLTEYQQMDPVMYDNHVTQIFNQSE
jgi:hypothetical protein